MELEIEQPLSLWIQISSLAFFLAGHFTDLLVIRIFLCFAYLFLLLNSIALVDSFAVCKVSIDGVLWSLLNLYVHLSTVIRLVVDEKPVSLTSP